MYIYVYIVDIYKKIIPWSITAASEHKGGEACHWGRMGDRRKLNNLGLHVGVEANKGPSISELIAIASR